MTRAAQTAELASLILLAGCCQFVYAANANAIASSVEFEPNRGQAPAGIRFLARAGNYTAQLREDGGISYEFAGRAGGRHGISFALAGGNSRPAAVAWGKLQSKTHYYVGNDPAAWRTDIPHYKRVQYEEVYPGIDLFYLDRHGHLEYEFRVAPGAQPEAIRLKFTARTTVERSGDLLVATAWGGLRHRRPTAYQTIGGRRRAVSAAFEQDGASIRFRLGPYDPRHTLIIDPVVTFSTYLGGDGWDAGYAVATDAAGDAYVTGDTASGTFPGRTSPAAGGRDVFVTKIRGGSTVLYTTILSSGGNDTGRAIAVDPSGNAYVAGISGGSNFPVSAGAIQSTFGGVEDAFIVKLDATGHIAFSTYVGGGGADGALGLALSTSGGVYAAGYTESVTFPTSAGAPQRALAGSRDAFLLQVAPGGNSLVYSTLLGGAGNDVGSAVTVDTTGNAILAGFTDSRNLPVRNAGQPAYAGSGDALLASLNAAGSAWNLVTYVGGSGMDQANGAAADSAGNIYLAGTTSSANFPAAAGGFRNGVSGTYDAFVLKMNSAGAVLYSSVLGGSGSDSATAIALGAAGEAWICGYTGSVDYPLADPLQNGTRGSFDGFVSMISPDGASLRFSTYFGGARDDRLLGIARDATAGVLITGYTSSADLQTTSGALQVAAPGGYSGLAAKIHYAVTAPRAESVTPYSGSGASQTFTFRVSDTAGYANLGTMLLVFNSTLSGANACYIFYSVAGNKMALAADSGAAWSNPVGLGVSAFLENSQCRLNVTTSSRLVNGTDLFLNLDITFKPAFAGAKSIFLYVENRAGLNSGWEQVGTWTVPNSVPPTAVSISPSSGIGATQRFAFRVTDPSGYENLGTMLVVFNSKLSGANACYFHYSTVANTLALASDAGDSWSNPVTLGASAVLENSQCRLNAATASRVVSGAELTLSIDISLKPAFAGAKSTFLYIANRTGLNSGWSQAGSWTVPSAAPPQAVSVSPSSGFGASQTFAFRVADPSGHENLGTMLVVINSVLSAANSCYLYYSASANMLALASDAGDGWSNPVALGAGVTLENRQCRVNVSTASRTLSGTELTVTVAIVFKPEFAGLKSSYLYVDNRSGLSSGWVKFGTWTVQ